MPDPNDDEANGADLAGFDRRNDWSWSAMTERWAEDRGTLLIGVAAVVAVVGSGVIAMRQNRFRPVAFPDATAIQRSRDLGLVPPLPSDEAASTPEQTISGSVGFELHGVAVQQGSVLVAIYDRQDAFDQNDPAAAISRLQFASDRPIARFQVSADQLPARFAVAAYQDHDGDGQLSRGPLGIPAEPYGFSRDARATLGRPSFGDAVVDRPGPDAPPITFELK